MCPLARLVASRPASCVKPLFDGTLAAWHAHDASNGAEVAQRIAAQTGGPTSRLSLSCCRTRRVPCSDGANCSGRGVGPARLCSGTRLMSGASQPNSSHVPRRSAAGRSRASSSRSHGPRPSETRGDRQGPSAHLSTSAAGRRPDTSQRIGTAAALPTLGGRPMVDRAAAATSRGHSQRGGLASRPLMRRARASGLHARACMAPGGHANRMR